MQVAGIHHLTIEGDRGEGLRHLGRARTLLDRLQNRMRLGGTQTGADMERVSERVLIDVRVAMGVNTVTITVGAAPQDEELVEIEVDVPDFLSGLVVGGYAQGGVLFGGVGPTGEPNGFFPTARTQQRFGLPSGQQSSERLSVPAKSGIAYKNVGTQCGGIVPTLYSGRMKSLVQLLLGYGMRQGASKYATRVMETKINAMQAHIGPLERIRGEEIKSSGCQVLYSFTRQRTHAVTTAADGALWLVEVSTDRGVMAMPLPVYAHSTLPAFRRRMEDSGELEAIAVLDAFQGFPTGQSFPDSDEELAELERAGLLLRMASAEDVEREISKANPLCDAHGWAFDSDGRVAEITGARRYAPRDILASPGETISSRITISIGASRRREYGQIRVQIANETAEVLKKAGMTEFAAAACAEKVFSLDEERLGRVASLDKYARARKIKNMTAQPIATAGCQIAEYASGTYGRYERNQALPSETRGRLPIHYSRCYFRAYRAWSKEKENFPLGDLPFGTDPYRNSDTIERSNVPNYDVELGSFFYDGGRASVRMAGIEIEVGEGRSFTTEREVYMDGRGYGPIMEKPPKYSYSVPDVKRISFEGETSFYVGVIDEKDVYSIHYETKGYTDWIDLTEKFAVDGYAFAVAPALMRDAIIYARRRASHTATSRNRGYSDIYHTVAYVTTVHLEQHAERPAPAHLPPIPQLPWTWDYSAETGPLEVREDVRLIHDGGGGIKVGPYYEWFMLDTMWAAATKNCLGPTQALIYHATPTLLEDTVHGYEERREVMKIEGSLGFSVQLPAKGSLCFIGVV